MDLSKNIHINVHLQKSWNKFGIENFLFECIEECKIEDIKSIEQKYLNDIFKLKNPNKKFYNIGVKSSGGDIKHNPKKLEIINKMKKSLKDRYSKMTIEQKEKRSENLKGSKNPNFGKKWNNEQRERMSKQRKGLVSKIKGKKLEDIIGKERADINKRLNSERGKKLIGDKNPNYKNPCKPELKKYFSDIQKGKKSKNFRMFCKPFKIENVSYVSLQDAAKDFNVNWGTIRHRIYSKSEKYNNYQLITDQKLIAYLFNEYEKKNFK